MKIVVPVAGIGSRFKKEADRNFEYKKPKPLINIKGKPMVAWAIGSLPFVNLPDRPAKTEFIVAPKDLVFICLEIHQEEHQIKERLEELFSPEIHVILIPEVTRGAVETALVAKDYMVADEDLIISDSDHYFDGTNLYQAILEKEEDTVGIIPVFLPPDDEPKWSYSLFNDQQVVSAVGEKAIELVKKGAYANIGGYYFSSGKIFKDEAQAMIREGDLTGAPGKKEFYVAPLYDRLIKKGMKIKVAIVPKVWGLGTPKDVEYFKRNFKG